MSTFCPIALTRLTKNTYSNDLTCEKARMEYFGQHLFRDACFEQSVHHGSRTSSTHPATIQNNIP